MLKLQDFISGQQEETGINTRLILQAYIEPSFNSDEKNKQREKKSRLKAMLVGMEFFLDFLSRIICVTTFPVMIVVLITRASYVTIPEDTA